MSKPKVEIIYTYGKPDGYDFPDKDSGELIVKVNGTDIAREIHVWLTRTRDFK